jgi:hypothetical protein
VEEYSPIVTTALDTTGFIKSTTELTLKNVTGINLDPRFNNRWSRSNKVTIETRNAANNAWILHRTFRLLSRTFDDGHRPTGSVSPSLRLSLGCKIALLDSNYQSQASYKIPVLSATPYVPFRTLLAYWLNYFGFPALALVSGDYAGNPEVLFDLAYTPGTSAAEHIGKFVYCYAKSHWWIDANENSRLEPINLAPTAAAFTYPPRQFAINTRSQNEKEKPAGLVRVLGVSNFVTAYNDPLPTATSVTTGNVTETSTFSVFTTPLTRTTTKTGTQTITGVSLSTGGGGSGSSANLGNLGQYLETTVEEYTGGFASQPNPIAGQPDIPGLPAWLNRGTVSVEEQRTTAGSNNLGGRSQTKSTVTEYYYRSTYSTVQGVTVTGVEVKKIVTTSKILPEGTTGGFNANALVDEVKTEDWIYIAPGQYKYTTTTIRPNDVENRRDLSGSNGVQNSPPPATQFAPQRINTQAVEIYGQALFQYPPEAPDNNHPRDFNLGIYLPSNARAEELAQIEGALIIGRAEMQDLAFTSTDAWLTDPRPFSIIFESQGYSATQDNVYLCDALSILCGLRQNYLFCSGVWLGVRDRITGVITPPYALTFAYLTDVNENILTDENGALLFNG